MKKVVSLGVVLVLGVFAVIGTAFATTSDCSHQNTVECLGDKTVESSTRYLCYKECQEVIVICEECKEVVNRYISEKTAEHEFSEYECTSCGYIDKVGKFTDILPIIGLVLILIIVIIYLVSRIFH